MNVTQVNFVEFEDFVDALEKSLGMKYCGIGAWNAPKDRMSFSIDLPSSSSDCYAYRGESKWLWAGYVNPPHDTDWQIKLCEDSRNPKHHTVSFYHCLLTLRDSGDLKDDFYVIRHEW